MMKTIDKGYDPLLKSNYELLSLKFSELKVLALSWYEGIDLSKFDNRFNREGTEHQLAVMKRSGIICNFFFAYKENDKYYLMDGFNRLFTDYGKLNSDGPVYLKVLTDKLEDNQLMTIMFQFNLWKLHTQGCVSEFSIDDFMDRGFRLFLYSKFGIKLYYYTNHSYHTRERENHDYEVLDYYFVREHDYCDRFKMEYDEVFVLMSNPNIINDFKEIIKSNDYLQPPFKNFERYLNGFIMFLSEKRISGDNGEYKFQTYLDKLYNDKKFFKKLQGMSWTDSTRKNIYRFLRDLNEQKQPERNDRKFIVETPPKNISL